MATLLDWFNIDLTQYFALFSFTDDSSLPELQFNSLDDKENTSPELNKNEFDKDFWEVEGNRKGMCFQ